MAGDDEGTHICTLSFLVNSQQVLSRVVLSGGFPFDKTTT